MVVYLIRHGQTDYNQKGLLQGKSNIPLNNNGIQEAWRNHNYFVDKNIDFCFTSPLKRALETAQIIFPKVNIIKSDLLIERNLGIFEGKSHDEYHFHNFWNYKLNSTYGNVESVRNLLDRSDSFLNYLKENYMNKTVVIVSHGAFLKALHFSIIGYNENTDFSCFTIKNCEIKKYEI